jgi:LAO/AO transport system kinase
VTARNIAEGVRRGDVRSLARLITFLENQQADALPALRALFPFTGRAYVVGITGAPGAGKSTLVDGLIHEVRAAGLTVAVLAVDPSSHFSGGAVLGDRIRMQGHATDAGVYIRSMSARGHLGGLARAARSATHLMDAAGWDVVFLETVGVGQSEMDIATAADTTVVVVTPGIGDTVQTMKAGILEIADVFALNKADQEGAQRVLLALRGMLHAAPATDWAVPIVETQAHQQRGVADLWAALQAHQTYLCRSGQLERRLRARLAKEIRDHVDHALRTTVLAGLLDSAEALSILDRVVDRAMDPGTAAEALVAGIQRQSKPGST